MPALTTIAASASLGRNAVFLVLLLVLGCSLPQARSAEPARGGIVGPQNCAECHRPMHDTWLHTRHHKSFSEMHRMRSARRIADRLGMERIKKGGQCATCHFTRDSPAAEALPIAGVSCESCHGPAEKWNTVHSDLTNPDRLQQAGKLGLIRPSMVYELASQCIKCHTVPDERLVNTGGHNVGGRFEIVAWLQGEVRHNFINSRGAHNAEVAPARARLLYVVGQGLALENALREFALSSGAGAYAQERAIRRKAALANLRRIQELISIQPLKGMVRTAEEIAFLPGNKSGLLKAADEIGALNRKIASDHTGAEFAALDKLLPKPDEFVGSVHRP